MAATSRVGRGYGGGLGGGDDVDGGGVREVLAEPVPALRDRLGLRIDAADPAPLAEADEAVADPKADLGLDLEAGLADEHVEGVGDPAVGRVLQRDDPEVDVAAGDLLEDGGDRAERDVLDRLAEAGDRGEVAVAVLRPEAGDPELALEGAGAADQLAEDEAQGLVRERPAAGLEGAGVDLVLARGGPDVEPGRLLDPADLHGDRGAVVEEVDQLAVDPVDLDAKVGQGGGGSARGRLVGGRGRRVGAGHGWFAEKDVGISIRLLVVGVPCGDAGRRSRSSIMERGRGVKRLGPAAPIRAISRPSRICYTPPSARPRTARPSRDLRCDLLPIWQKGPRLVPAAKMAECPDGRRGRFLDGCRKSNSEIG